MSTSISEDRFTFSLPSLSYIDTSLEEQNTFTARPARPHGFVEWLAGRVAAFRTWNAERRALNELSQMSDRELFDVGLNRYDFGRMFNDATNEDLRNRGRLA